MATVTAVAAVAVTATAGGCEWRGVNSLSLPGTAGRDDGAYVVTAELANVTNIERNARVRVGDVTIGHVTNVARQGWHALVTMSIDGAVDLPANATATVAQTSLLGSLHIELAPPTGVPAQGRLRGGSRIPLESTSEYPTTEQTLAAISMLLNGGGLGKIQDITTALTAAMGGRENDIRALIENLGEFTGELDSQVDDITAAIDSLNNLVGQFAADEPVLDRALQTVPAALAEVNAQRNALVEATDLLGKLSALAADTVNQSKAALADELPKLWPILKSLADSGPALTKSLNMLFTYPYPMNLLDKVFRGDYANGDMIMDLTLSRLDTTLFTGTRWEGHLTALEMQWGRTIGQKPSPYTAGNPLIAPYHHEPVR